MCDVHLIETSRIEDYTHEGLRCSYCEDPIEGSTVIISGHLDDGSPGVYVFTYHADCVYLMEHDLPPEGEGCFSYGTAARVYQKES